MDVLRLTPSSNVFYQYLSIAFSHFCTTYLYRFFAENNFTINLYVCLTVGKVMSSKDPESTNNVHDLNFICVVFYNKMLKKNPNITNIERKSKIINIFIVFEIFK